eukprot:Colp12_sorted_trinity150504_noHs@33630
MSTPTTNTPTEELAVPDASTKAQRSTEDITALRQFSTDMTDDPMAERSVSYGEGSEQALAQQEALDAAADLHNSMVWRRDLYVALTKGSISTLTKLFEAHGLDAVIDEAIVGKKDAYGDAWEEPVLHTAVQAAQYGVCKWLLARGASPVSEDTLGRVPLELAEGSQCYYLIEGAIPKEGMPSAPHPPTFHSSDATSITINFVPDTAGPDYTKWDVQYGWPYLGSWADASLVTHVSKSESTYKVANLAAATGYVFRTRAFNRNGWVAWGAKSAVMRTQDA